MIGKEANLGDIRQEQIREQTTMWLVLSRGPEVPEETIDFYTEKANELLNYIIESSKKLGIAPEIFIKSFKMGRF
jgi:hypothetical protein